MQIIDMSSLLQAHQDLPEILKSAYIIQETRRTSDNVFFIDTNKISEELLSTVMSDLRGRGIEPFITNKPLYHYIDSIQEGYNPPLELLSQDYLALSRANENTYIWDISTMRRYSPSEFSSEVLDFPHKRLGFFALLSQDRYHNISTGIDFTPSSVISLAKEHESLSELLSSESVPVNLKDKVLALSHKVPELVSSLKIQHESLDCESYVSSITLSNEEMKEIKGSVVDVDMGTASFYPLTNTLKIAQLIKAIEESGTKSIIIENDMKNIAIRANNKNYIAFENDDMTAEQMYNTFSVLLSNENVEKVAYSAKSCHLHALKKGASIMALRDDIEMAEFTANNLTVNKDIDSLMSHYFFEKSPQATGLERMSRNLDSIERLHLKLMDILADQGSTKHYRAVEMPTTKLLAEMEFRGTYVNSGKLLKMSRYLSEEIEKETNLIRQYSPKPINLNTAKEVAGLIYDVLGFKGKGRSTAKDVLLKLGKESGHPIFASIIRFRELANLNSGFALSLPSKINPNTNRVHGKYIQNKVVTGRLSCQDPNLQGIPSKSKIGNSIRNAFEAGKNRSNVVADYSQVELKVLAHLAQEEQLISSFREGRDIHQATAALVNNKPYSEVTKSERKAAKATNFGIIYGITEYGLSSDLGISLFKARNFIENYLNKLPQAANFIKNSQYEAQHNGYVKSVTGRRIYIEGAQDTGDERKFKKAMRAASNAPMQGSAADIMKLSMIKVANELKSNQLDAFITIQVHDEIVVECDKSIELKVAKIVKESMESAVKLSVDLDVDIDTGPSWGAAKSIEPKDLEHEVTMEP